MKSNNTRTIIGIILVALGFMMVADNFFFFHFPIFDLIFSFPTILLAISLIILFNNKNSVPGYILLALALLFYSKELFHFSIGQIIHDYWPVILILIGIAILIRRNNGVNVSADKYAQPNGEDTDINTVEEDILDEVVIFGGIDKKVNSKNFKGGRITTLFGGSDIYLFNSKLAEGRNTLDLFIMFGGVDLFVPKDWKIIVNVVSIFGGFDDERKKEFIPEADDSKVLVIKGFVLFGGGDIK